jgi:hypothetical protein
MARVQAEPPVAAWAHLISYVAFGLAAIAAIGAVVFRVVETPREQ